MAIPYQPAKFKSANTFAMAIWDQTTKINLIPANISGYTVVSSYNNIVFVGSEDTIAPRTAETSLFLSKMVWTTAKTNMAGVTRITIHHE